MRFTVGDSQGVGFKGLLTFCCTYTHNFFDKVVQMY